TGPAVAAALHVQARLGPGVPGAARDLHRPHRGRGPSPLRRVHRHVGRALPGHDRDVATSSSRSSSSPSSSERLSIQPTPSSHSTPGSAKRSGTEGHFPHEQPALKVLYLVATERRPNRSNPTGRINACKTI